MNKIKEEINKASVYSNKEKYDEAIEILEKLYKDNPDSEKIKKILIKTLFDYGGYLNDNYISDYNKALFIFSKILDLEHKNYRALYNLGITYYNLKKNENALEYYNKALAIKPDYKYCYYNIGLIYEDMEELQKALESFEKALEIDGNFTYALQAKNCVRKKIDTLKYSKSRE